MSIVDPNSLFIKGRIDTLTVEGKIVQKNLVILNEKNKEIAKLAIAHFENAQEQNPPQLKKDYVPITYLNRRDQSCVAKITIDALKKFGFSDEELEYYTDEGIDAGTLEKTILEKIEEQTKPKEEIVSQPKAEENKEPEKKEAPSLETVETGIQKEEKKVVELPVDPLVQFQNKLLSKGLNQEALNNITKALKEVFEKYPPAILQGDTIQTAQGPVEYFQNHTYKILGEGSFGVVKQIFDKNMQPLVLKIAKYTLMNPNQLESNRVQLSITDLLNEFIVLKRIHQNGIVEGIQKPHFQVALLSGQIGILTQSYEGSLVNEDKIFDILFKDITADEFINNFDRLVGALKYMSDQNIFNGDIKPHNILWTTKTDSSGKSEVVWDFADMGGARFMDDPEYLTENPLGVVSERFYERLDWIAANEAHKAVTQQKPNTSAYRKALNNYKEIQKKRMVNSLKLTLRELYEKMDEKQLPKDKLAKIRARMAIIEKAATKDPLIPNCLTVEELYSTLQALKSKE